MDEVNACIAANAEIEELVDKPDFVKGVVRVAGPFTMEGVISVEQGLDTPVGGEPEELETFDGDTAVAMPRHIWTRFSVCSRRVEWIFPATRT